MKIFGHPVHMMLVHFPSALIPMDLACSIIYHFTGMASFAYASYYSMIGASALGCLAIITGAFDLLALIGKDKRILNKALIHGGINLVVLLFYIAVSYIQFRKQDKILTDSITLLISKAIANCLMIIGNFIGGSLILKYKVAVENG
jgi:uncharacterized membrane protein